MRFCLLGSGSEGNAILLATSSAKILIDNGLSFRQLRLRAARVRETLDDLKAVFVTHEHGDHVNGLGTLARALHVPIYMTSGTYGNLPKSVGKIPRFEVFEAGDTITVDGIAAQSFSVSHDAADPVSFVLSAERAKLGIAADLGHISQLVRNRLAGSHALILESNYCPEMLTRGSYPPAVQQRIRGRQGHLSNSDAGSLLTGLLHVALQVVVLVHISEQNNTRRRAYMTASRAVQDHPATVFVARQDRPTRMFKIAL